MVDSLEAEDTFSKRSSFIPSVHEVAWEWEANDPASVNAFLPTAYGLVVSHNSASVTALHGESGAELWNRESRGSRSTVAVTPDGLETVFVDRSVDEEGDDGDGELIIVDAGSGVELASSPAPENAVSRSDLVTENHLLVSTNGEITAHDLHNGEPSWTYTPESHCLRIPEYVRDEDWRWPVTTAQGAVLLPIVCSFEGSSAPENQGQDVTMYALALDESDGTELWLSNPVSTTLSDDPLGNLYNYSLRPSDDGEYLIQSISQDFRLLEFSTGETIEEHWPEEGRGGISLTDRVSATADHVVWYEDPEEGQDYRYVKYSHSGEMLNEISVSQNQHALVDPGSWSPQGRVTDLTEGLLTYGCAGACPRTGNMESPLSAMFTPWDGSDAVTIELGQLDSNRGSDDYGARFLPVPGAVISYQVMPGESPIGTLVALN